KTGNRASLLHLLDDTPGLAFALGVGVAVTAAETEPLQQPAALFLHRLGLRDTARHVGRAKFATKAKRRAPGQSASVTLEPTTQRQSMPSSPASRALLGKRLNSCDQTRIAPVEPYRPVGWLSSLPTQATARWSPVYPANQLSRLSLLVPVLPAAASSPRPSATSRRPVPEDTACCNAMVISRAATASLSFAGAGSWS